MKFNIFNNYFYFSSFFLATTLILVSCSTGNRNTVEYQENNQLGALIQTYLAKNAAESDDFLSKALLAYDTTEENKKLIEEHSNTILLFFRADILANTTSQKLKSKVLAEKVKQTTDIGNTVSVLLSLYPIDSYRLLGYFSRNETISNETLLDIGIQHNLDPSILLTASSSGLVNSVTPLIHSAGIVIYAQSEDNIGEVKFREYSNGDWQPAYDLAWDPIYGALSGSIVHLQANTEYEVLIQVSNFETSIEEYQFRFKTRPNTPPVDPTKIYYLSEIYTGGQLDLEALNIQGGNEGYAKIIGDGPIIDASDSYDSAVYIGSQSHIMLENLTIRGGKRFGIHADKANNIWVKGCDIASYGRIANVYKNGKGYETVESTSPINYDSGIYLQQTGVTVVEECEIHSPNGTANHWGNGHPNGPNAMLVYANHPDEKYRGQIIIRNNRFYGTDTHRFNDVIEGRNNFYRSGGFIRDSAIYGNYLAYANDDLIEIDGGQRNVLVYENEITQGYAGISIAPNRLGPSYIFHNHIHDLGDERGKEWTAIKAGGLMTQPGGKTYIIENYINTARNGIAASNVNGDSTFWIEVINNVIINHNFNNKVGLEVYDSQKYYGSSFTNNIMFNTKINAPNLDIATNNLVEHPLTYDSEFISTYIGTEELHYLPIQNNNWVANFSRGSAYSEADNAYGIATNLPAAPFYTDEAGLRDFIKIDESKLSKFSTQTKYGSIIALSETSLEITGNGWYKLPVNYSVKPNSTLSFDIKVVGEVEIAGIALEINNTQTQSAIFRLAGSQNYGNDISHLISGNGFNSVTLDVGNYGFEDIEYLVFILDNDIDEASNNGAVYFENLKFHTPSEAEPNTIYHEKVLIGIDNTK
ncbi:right-handed parallel beta-helix repeat-containing protein [uncultured Alteromonas sp.]|uniref:right-handed parallel beta-helix repeat-containing protein n=1 Tax=uncultured Alteromonas sp. TaxID=179113 RepID=UPI0030D751AE